SGVAADAENVSVPVPPNSMSAALGVGACALDAAVHAWDLAVAAGLPRRRRPRSRGSCSPSRNRS
ncbi:hypothetical protein ACFFQA_26440, partial [Allokutzneria oryzae]